MTTTKPITKTPGVCGGDACIRGTRLTVWGLIESRRAGISDERLLDAYPKLTQEELQAAWEYARMNSLEIERALWENEVCMVEHDGTNISPDLVYRGEQLGFSDAQILVAFEPPLAATALDAMRRLSGRA